MRKPNARPGFAGAYLLKTPAQLNTIFVTSDSEDEINYKFTMVPNFDYPPPRPNRVQAWVYTILNPIIESLRQELLLIDKGNLSWRFYSGKCEYIRPIAEYIDGGQAPNFEDFLTDGINQGLKSGIDAHDEAVSQVETTAGAFFDRLMNSSLFRREVDEAFAEYVSLSGVKPEYPNLGSIKSDLSKYVAEYIINKTTRLPSHYLIHKFWDDFQSKFKQLAAGRFEAYEQRDSFQLFNQAVDKLKDVSGGLLAALEKHRFLLCSTYDIPAAPIATSTSHGGDLYVSNK
jgi:hypothetical protein